MKPCYFRTEKEAREHIAKMHAAGFRTRLIFISPTQWQVDVWSAKGVYA